MTNDSRFFERMFLISAALFAVTATLYGVFLSVYYNLYGISVELSVINQTKANEISNVINNRVIFDYAAWKAILTLSIILITASGFSFLLHNRLSDENRDLAESLLVFLLMLHFASFFTFIFGIVNEYFIFALILIAAILTWFYSKIDEPKRREKDD